VRGENFFLNGIILPGEKTSWALLSEAKSFFWHKLCGYTRKPIIKGGFIQGRLPFAQHRERGWVYGCLVEVFELELVV
jgi:hypothetical protein